jgi:serine/threonine-protein kinase
MLVNRKDEDDFVKVLDFGISRDLERESASRRRPGLTRPDMAVGTPTYMAPEQAAGMPANALSDVYAVGGLLYEMLTAHPPCQGDDVLSVLNKKATEDPIPVGRLRPDLPADVQALVMRALSRSGRDRQQSMTRLKEEVLACLGTGQSAPNPVGARGSSDPTTQRMVTFQPRPWMLGAGVAALVGMMAVTSLVRRDRKGQRVAAPPTAEAATEAQPASAAPRAVPPVIVPGEPVGRTPAPLRMRPVPLAAPRPLPPPEATPVWPTSPPPPVFAAPATQSVPPAMRRPSTAGHAPTERHASGEGAVLASIDTPPSQISEQVLANGQTAFDRGNYPEAVRRGKEAISAGNKVAGHLLVGDAYFHLQRYPDAAREYKAALAIDPDNALARRGRELAEKAAATP